LPRRRKPAIVVAVVLAAGAGKRAGTRIPKQFVQLPGGTLLDHALLRVGSHPRVASVVVVVPPGRVKSLAGLPGKHPKVTAVVAGGARRQDSVRRGLKALKAGPGDIVLIHDAARPLVPSHVIDAVIDGALESGAAVPGIEPADTVKEVTPGGMVRRTLPRERLRLIQTPQAFRLDWLAEAAAKGAGRRLWTDEASILEASGRRVRVVEGSPMSFKVTTLGDVARLRALLEKMP